MPFKEIKVIHLQDAVDKSEKNYPPLRKIKVVINQMYKWAMKYVICPKDYSRYVDIIKWKHKNPRKRDQHRWWTKEHIDILWNVSEERQYQVMLMMIYTGVRISELLELKKENVNLEEQYFDIKISKTADGIRRVPIANDILPFFKDWYEYSKADTPLCTREHQPFMYRNFLDSYWDTVLEPLGMKYRPHSTRHTYVSLLAGAKVDQTTIKKIVGHRGAMTLTERVYTHLDIEVLIEAVNRMYKPTL